MATERTNDLYAFKSFIDEQLTNGGSNLTLDEALDQLANVENQTEEERAETLKAIRLGSTICTLGEPSTRSSLSSGCGRVPALCCP